MNNCNFTYNHYKEVLQKALDKKYEIMGCAEYLKRKKLGQLHSKVLVMRHDVDAKLIRAYEMARIEKELDINTTYFIRVFSNEYNIFDYNCLPLIRKIEEMGHEIGYHAEPVDVSRNTGMEYDRCFRIGKRALELITDNEVIGVASHREATGNNNLQEYLKNANYEHLEVQYEAYDNRTFDLFEKSHYVTDGYEWYWRSYEKGKLTDKRQCLCKIIEEDNPLIYCLVHPNSWYKKHYHNIFSVED